MPRYFLTALAVSVAGHVLAAESPVDYQKNIKPILAARCYACHGALQQKAGLRVDTAKSLITARVVRPGKSGESPIMAHVRGQMDYERMPPNSEGEGLSANQITLLQRWIDEGAVAPPDEAADPDPREHWAFRQPTQSSLPAASFSLNPVDRFLAAEWAKRGLKPQPQAEAQLLLRRLYLDLTGLPPTPAETKTFLGDRSPDAYEKVVDKLLASPQYGERWGRHFLDIWRYSDQWGLGAEVRNSQKHMWHWRDWVVESLNTDAGYDAMIRQMLAADEFYPTDPAKLRATGFLARQYFIFNRTTWLDETIEHTGKAFLGLTFNCSKCHDHKFDPISQTNYYQLRAFFEPYQVRLDMVGAETDFEKDGLPRAFDCNATAPTYKHVRGDERRPLTNASISPGVPAVLSFAEWKIEPVKLPFEAHSPHLSPRIRQAHLLAAKKDGDLAVEAVTARIEADLLKVNGPMDQYKAAAIRAARAEKTLALVKAVDAFLQAEDSLAKAEGSSKPAAFKKRDSARAALAAARKAIEKTSEDYKPLRGSRKSPESNLETEASRNKPFPTTSSGRRSALAKWITDARNPLTARVLVNHVWARHFGRPLVATLFDFGRRGAGPTHPELLDWLAVEFMERNWSLKQLHRTIVSSRAYRMTSSSRGAAAVNLRIDAENKYLWRRNPVRMEAQAVRDSLLQLAGQLDVTVGGPSVPLAQQDESRRRSMYFFQSHNDHHKFLSQFDDANVLECYRRTESIVPQQALSLSNSKFALVMSAAIAKKLNEQIGEADDDRFVAAAFETILACSPTNDERKACREALADWVALLKEQKHPSPVEKARINLVGSLINHNDFVTVR